MWGYYINHTDTAKYKTYSCFACALWNCTQESVLESKGGMFLQNSVRAPARFRPETDGAKSDIGRS